MKNVSQSYEWPQSNVSTSMPLMDFLQAAWLWKHHSMNGLLCPPFQIILSCLWSRSKSVIEFLPQTLILFILLWIWIWTYIFEFEALSKQSQNGKIFFNIFQHVWEKKVSLTCKLYFTVIRGKQKSLNVLNTVKSQAVDCLG